jgi:predicted PurR-regulated permease PerM
MPRCTKGRGIRGRPSEVSEPSAPPALRLASDYAWRLLVLAAAVLATVYLLAKLRLVVLPVFVALLLASILSPPARLLERRGVPTLAASWLTFGGLLLLLGTIVTLIVPAIADEFDELGPVVSEGVDDVERWLVEGPLELSRDEIVRYREQAGERLSEFARSSSGSVVAGAVAVAETVAGIVLAFVLTFFFVKDGPKFQRWWVDRLPAARRDVVRACARRAWDALSGFLRGAAAIGLLEAVIIGVTLWIVGAHLVAPVMVLTFLAAFFPIVGAVVAGIIATLVALVSGGPGDALVVGIVCILVQQFDNDLLAPLIYGRFINLHPVVVLLTITAGGTLGGIAGAFLAVPVAAVVAAIAGELWRRREAAAT